MSNDQDNDTIGSFYMGRMRPPPPPPSQRKMPKGILTVVALIAFIAIVWYTYPRGQEKYEGTDVPVIKADTSPYKFKPDDPGGMEVRHQDSTIFDPLEKKNSGGEVEKLMPATEEPVGKDGVKEEAQLEKPTPQLNLDTQMQKVGSDTEKVVFPKTEAAKKPDPKADTKMPAKTEKPATKEPAKEAVKDTSKMTPEKQALEKAAAADKAAVKKDAKPVTKAPAIATDKPAAGGIYVRLGSYKNKAGANEDWTMLQKKYPQYLNGLKIRVVPVDLGAKGTFNRLEAGTVTDTRAKEICTALAKTPGGCIVVK